MAKEQTHTIEEVHAAYNLLTRVGYTVSRPEKEPQEELTEAEECCKWIGDFVCTAKDGGDAWCAVRKHPGAGEWGKKLRRVWDSIKSGGE